MPAIPALETASIVSVPTPCPFQQCGNNKVLHLKQCLLCRSSELPTLLITIASRCQVPCWPYA